MVHNSLGSWALGPGWSIWWQIAWKKTWAWHRHFLFFIFSFEHILVLTEANDGSQLQKDYCTVYDLDVAQMGVSEHNKDDDRNRPVWYLQPSIYCVLLFAEEVVDIVRQKYELQNIAVHARVIEPFVFKCVGLYFGKRIRLWVVPGIFQY